MKQKQRIALLGIAAFALIFAACGGDSGNNGTETEGDSSSSAGIYSSGGQVNSSSVVKSSSSSIVVSSSSAKALSSSSVTLSSSIAKSSSSSVVVSSSSVKVQSSSSVTAGVVDPSTVISGTMTDSRDGQSYKTVKIGTQTWMAENLNYADSIAMPNIKGNSWCYENSADSCAKYGRLYTWTGAMNIDGSYQSASAAAEISAPWRGACPTGWHIPTDAEWTTLATAVGGSSVAGTKFKSTSGWYNGDNGTDAYGFSALPAGFCSYSGSFDYVGYYAYFWSATENESDYAYYRYLGYDYAYIDTYGRLKNLAFSVRCVQDF